MLHLATIFRKIGFANLLSVISLLASTTCFVLLAHIAYRNTVHSLVATEPQYIRTEDIKVTAEDTEVRVSPSSQENIVNDIDKLIENIPDDNYKKYSAEDSETLQKILHQANTKNRNIKDNDGSKMDNTDKNVYAKNNSRYKVISSKILSKEQYKVQLAAFKTHSEAVASWFRIKQKHHAILSQFNYTVFKADEGALYLLQILCQNMAEAEQLCGTLKENKITCIIVK